MAKISNKRKYKYCTTDGCISYFKVRIDFDDGTKTFIIEQPDGTKGRQGKKSLLYNLPNIIKSDVIYFVEGEKCANAIIELGYTATTLDSGANSHWESDFTDILKNKTVIILPDNDNPGIKYAKNIKKNIPWASVKELPELSKKEDIFDWLKKGHSISEIENIPETIFEDITINNSEGENMSDEKDKTTQSERLLDFIKNEKIKLFLNETNDTYAEICVGGHKEILAVNNNEFFLWAQKLYFKQTGKTIRQDNLKQVINILNAETRFGDNPNVTLYNRVAKSDNCFWYDLTNKSWESIKISEKGWSVENDGPTLFCRYRHQQPQITPKQGGDISRIFEYINVKQYKTLFTCWLVSCFVPDIPHPMPIIHGEKGAAKSTACVLLKKLIDPSSLETLTLNKNEKSLIINLKQHFYLPFDNVSVISNEISDTLCRAITGGALQQRKLFTDEDDCIFTFKRCLTINGINNVANRADLLDRSIMFELERVSPTNRKKLQDIYKSFEEDRPYLLGSIFDILSKAMSIYPTVDLQELPRMADFCQWGFAIAEAMGGLGNKFLEEYNSNQSIQNDEAIDADPCAFLIVEYMRNKDCWNGRVSEFLIALKTEAENQGFNTKNSTILPQAPNALSRRIKAIKSNLETVGITIVFDNDNHSDGKHIFVTNNNLSPFPSYQIPPQKICGISNEPNGDNGDKIIASILHDNDDEDYDDKEVNF